MGDTVLGTEESKLKKSDQSQHPCETRQFGGAPSSVACVRGRFTAHAEEGLASDPPWLTDQTPGAILLPDRDPWDMSSLVTGLHVGTAEEGK